MSTSTSGKAADAAAQAIQNIINGGATLCLLGSDPAYGDSASDVVTAAGATTAIAESDVSISTPADFSGVTTLELTSDIDFGAVDAGVLSTFAVVAESSTLDGTGGAWILGEEIPGQPDTTGEDVTVPSGQTLFEDGNPS